MRCRSGKARWRTKPKTPAAASSRSAARRQQVAQVDADIAMVGHRESSIVAPNLRTTISLGGNSLAQAMPQTPLAGGATDTAQAASGLISTA